MTYIHENSVVSISISRLTVSNGIFFSGMEIVFFSLLLAFHFSDGLLPQWIIISVWLVILKKKKSFFLL